MACFNGYELIQETALDPSDRKLFRLYFDSTKDLSSCIISSVTRIPGWMIRLLQRKGIKPLIMNVETRLPFANTYLSKESLGNDRKAAVAGACHLYPGKNVLIINAGTAITFDFKNSMEEFLGGNISPGLTMRFRALHHFTSKLPLLKSETTHVYLGRTTDEAIQSGVQNGIGAEIKSYIDYFNNNYENLTVILTGGDIHFFENLAKKSIFVVSNLTLIGLNIIQKYNAENP
jgi:type III pantothenate kinase